MFRVVLTFILCTASVMANAQLLSLNANGGGTWLGINIAPINYYSPAQPFLNIAKSTSTWSTTPAGGEGSITLDANGYPTAIPATYTAIFTNFNMALPTPANGASPYPGGTYYAYYDCTGCTIAWSNDATLVTHAAGDSGISNWKDTLTVTPSFNGIHMTITATGTAPNNFRNLRIVRSQYYNLFNSGEMWNPAYESFLQPFHGGIRFMDYSQVNTSPAVNWADRSTDANPFWGGSASTVYSGGALIPVGGSYESMIRLCNDLVVHYCYFTIPAKATDAYVTNLASLIYTTLNSPIVAIIEYGNEIWNFTAAGQDGRYVYDLGNTFFNPHLPAWSSTTTYNTNDLSVANGFTWISCGASNLNNPPPSVEDTFCWQGGKWGLAQNTIAFSYQVKRTSEIADIFASTFGGSFANRVMVTLGQQAAGSGATSYKFAYDSTGHNGQLYCYSNTAFPLPASCTQVMSANIGAINIAPYFGYCANDAWSLDQLFQEILSGGATPASTCSPYAGGMVAQAVSFIAPQVTLANSPAASVKGGGSFKVIGYEGGQTFAGGDATQQGLYLAANRDPRMGIANQQLINGWKTNNPATPIFFYYQDAYPAGSNNDYWGTVDTIMDLGGDNTSVKYNALKSTN